jgi:hypothetical protein
MNGYQYRVIVNGTCTPLNTLSGAAILTVNVPGSITTNPVNSTVCEGSNTSFTVVASGSSPLYQWQVSIDGGITYSDLNGANSATLNFNGVTNSMSLNRYRAVVTITSCGSVISAGAILKVNPLPVVTLTSAPLSQLKPGLTTTLFATSNPAGVTYSWSLNGSVIAGAASRTLVIDVNGMGKYKATVTDINGCTNTTNELLITALPDQHLFIYPNPTTDGRFQVRLYSSIVLDTRKIIIYNALGEVVRKREFTTTSSYQENSFDLSNMAPGVYMVEVRDRHDVKTVAGKVIIK